MSSFPVAGVGYFDIESVALQDLTQRKCRLRSLAIPHPPTEWVTSGLIAALERCLHNNPIPHPFHGVVRICRVSVDFYDGHCCKVQALKKVGYVGYIQTNGNLLINIWNSKIK